jgi:uncharacterized protein (DUF302 family)
MRKIIAALFLTLLLAGPAAAQGGLVSVKSSHDVTATAERLENALQAKGLTLFSRIDYAANAENIGQTLKPTLLVIFGDPSLATPLIQRSRSIGIDLPMKVLIWEDRDGQVWFTYNAPDYLARRHGITEMGDIIQKMQQVLSDLAMAATLP